MIRGKITTSAKHVPEVVHGYIDVQRYLRNPLSGKADEYPAKRDPESLVKRVSVYILEMKNEVLRDIKIMDISTLFDVHPSFLSRKFKYSMKTTLQEFIHQIKIQRAVMLLQQDALQENRAGSKRSDSLRIDGLADTLGFSSTEYFIRCFKKRIGVSPGTYRKCFKLQTGGLT